MNMESVKRNKPDWALKRLNLKNKEIKIVIIDGEKCAQIPLTRGKTALIDFKDLPLVSNYSWSLSISQPGYYYAKTCIKGKNVMMHGMILNSKYIDHINHDGLNNRILNLRIVDQVKNGWNRRKLKKGASIYKGVYKRINDKKWRSSIILNGKQNVIGFYDDEIEAAKAYDKRAKEDFGEYAHLNFQPAKQALQQSEEK